MDLYYLSTCVKVNEGKYIISFKDYSKEYMEYLSHMFPYKQIEIEVVIKYLGFVIKPNYYFKND